MYKKLLVIIASVLVLGSLGSAYAAGEIVITPVLNFTVVPKKQDLRPVSMKEFFIQYCNTVGVGLPEVFRQIPLRIPGVTRDDPLYAALQRCTYLGFLPNTAVSYLWGNPVSSKFVNVFVSKTLHIDPNVNEDNDKLTRDDFGNLIDRLPNYKMLMSIGAQSNRGLNGNYQSQLINAQGFNVLTQVYQLLKSDYRTGAQVTDETLVQGAIRGMSNAVGDIHTEYFPPVEAKDFNDQLNGSFEGIGGYLEMLHPGEVVITSVIKDAPAAKAGLMANDRIIKVDDYQITAKDSLDTVISKIKGPAGTSVKITVDRNGVQSVISVTRAKITISMLDYSFTRNTPIMSIHSFGWGIASTWAESLKTHAAQIQNAGKLIIDLRDNPGGSLQDVSDMLSDFVPKDQPVVVTRSRYQEENVLSAGRNIVDFTKVHIVILINGSSASASEIMAGTIKDYLPQTTIVGETSYGKGSVQYLQPFDDNSSFKITIAHRYTGKTKTAIDGIGIKPDIEVVLDQEQAKQGYDNQMEAALAQ